MDLKLKGRAFFITGIGRGIGRCVAEALLAEGAFVAGCARHASGLERFSATLTAEQRDRLLVAEADVGDRERLAQLVTEAGSTFGRLDGVVANAGSGSSGGVLETPDSDWDDQVRIKMQSVLNLVRPAIPALSSSDHGRVVIMNSITARWPDPSMAAVSAARAAVASVATSLAVELSADGILVNTVNLGAIATERQVARHRDSGTTLTYDEWAARESVRRGILLGRFGQPDEVVPAVLLLLSPVASYITGTTIDVAGGLFSMPGAVPTSTTAPEAKID